MANNVIDLVVQIPSLPEGFQGTPDDLLEFISENAIFLLEGQAPSIQIGGSTPTQNVGIYFTPDSVQYFANGKYSPITDVPVGSYFPFAGTIVPNYYLFCDGSTYLQADYPALYAAIGAQYNPAGFTGASTSFCVPNMAGRVSIGAGTGDYALNNANIVGKMAPVLAAVYFGLEWIRNISSANVAPSSKMRVAANALFTSGGDITSVTPPALGTNFIIRAK